MVTKSALLDDPTHPCAHLWTQHLFHGFRPCRIPPVEVPGVIWTGDYAIPAADTARVNVCNNAVAFVSSRGVHRADERAWRMMGRIAVHAWPWKIGELVVRIVLAILQIEDLQPSDGTDLVAFIGAE